MTKRGALTRLLADLRRRLAAAESAGDDDEAVRLDRRIGHVERMLAALR